MLYPDEDQACPMNAAADVAVAKRLLGRLEDGEARAKGLPKEEVRRSLARRMRVLPGTLRNIRKNRVKSIPHWMMVRIRAELIAVLQHEANRIQHEIHLARQTGVDHRENNLAKAEAQLVEAQAILRDVS